MSAAHLFMCRIPVELVSGFVTEPFVSIETLSEPVEIILQPSKVGVFPLSEKTLFRKNTCLEGL